MPSGKEYETLFLLSAKMDSSFGGTFTKANQQLAEMQKDLMELNKTQSDIRAYEKQQEAIEKNRTKLEGLRAEYEETQREILTAGDAAGDLSKKLSENENEFWKTAAAMRKNEESLELMSNKLEEAGYDTRKLSEASAELSKKQEGLRKQQEKLTKGTDSATESYAKLIIAVGAMDKVAVVARWFSDNAQAAMDFETAMTGVEKTTDLTAAELSAMSSEIKALSTEIPVAAVELAKITENAGQLGIQKENLVDFTRTMADLGVATNLTGEDAAQTFAKFANITGMPQTEFANLGSTVVELGNNLATTESDIASTDTSSSIRGQKNSLLCRRQSSACIPSSGLCSGRRRGTTRRQRSKTLTSK